MSDQNVISIAVRISGRVQGVGFRYWTKREADSLKVNGQVRNLADGTVEVLAEGSADAVEALLEQLRHGPSLAEVAEVRIEPRPVSGCKDFKYAG